MQTFPTPQPCVILETALALLGVSRRTLWRRISEGSIGRGLDDSRGRAMVYAADVLKQMPCPLAPESARLLARADAGDVDAQNEVGIAFDEAGDRKSAIYWWTLAADGGDPDSMQLLGRCYADGGGVPQDSNLAIMWVSKAAAKGHAVARAQMDGVSWG